MKPLYSFKSVASYLQLLILSIIFFLSACKRDDDKTQDPTQTCEYKLAHAADFTAMEVVDYNNYWVLYDSDTALHKVQFKAVSTLGKSYTWHIGKDTINGNSVTVDFSSLIGLQNTVQIVLSTKVSALNTCGHTRDTVITKTRYITSLFADSTGGIYSLHGNTQVEGIWKGNFSNVPDKMYTVQFKFDGIRRISKDQLSCYSDWVRDSLTQVEVFGILPNTDLHISCDQKGVSCSCDFGPVDFGFKEMVANTWAYNNITKRKVGIAAIALVSPTNRDSIRITYLESTYDSLKRKYVPINYYFSGVRLQ